MNPQPMKSDAERVAYLADVLKMNPLLKAEEILNRRNRFLGTPSASATLQSSAVEFYEQREKATRTIARLRAEFWKLDLKVLVKTLRALEVKPYPDLQIAAARLQVLARHRADLPALSEDRTFDGALFTKLKLILVSSPRDAAPIKDQTMRSLENADRLRQAQPMVKLLQARLPDVYDLEADWLATILRLRVKDLDPPVRVEREREPVRDRNEGFSYEDNGWTIWGILGFIGLVLRALLKVGAKKNEEPRR